MQDEVAWLVNEGWLRRVWYLKSVTSNSTILFMKLAASLKPLVFTPGEFCPQGFLYFIKRGQVLPRVTHTATCHVPLHRSAST